MTTYHKDGGMGLVNDSDGPKPKDTKSLPWSWRGEEQPVYVIQRRPFGTHSAWEIWVQHDGIKISPVQLTKLLADVVQSQVKVTDLPSEGLEPPQQPSDAPSEITIKGNEWSRQTSKPKLEDRIKPPPSGPSSTDSEINEILNSLRWLDTEINNPELVKEHELSFRKARTAIESLLTKREQAARVKLLQELSTYMYELHDNDLQGMERHIEVTLQADLTKDSEKS